METSQLTPEKTYIQDEVCDQIMTVTKELVDIHGASNITVKMVINKMGVTNRVFYNRFPNIETVLISIYNDIVLKMRDCLKSKYNYKTHFRSYCDDVACNILVSNILLKNKFAHFHFFHDSMSKENATWWMKTMGKMVHEAIELGAAKPNDCYHVAYALWCFCRGVSADAIGRGIGDLDSTKKHFREIFGYFLDGIGAIDIEK